MGGDKAAKVWLLHLHLNCAIDPGVLSTEHPPSSVVLLGYFYILYFLFPFFIFQTSMGFYFFSTVLGTSVLCCQWNREFSAEPPTPPKRMIKVHFLAIYFSTAFITGQRMFSENSSSIINFSFILLPCKCSRFFQCFIFLCCCFFNSCKNLKRFLFTPCWLIWPFSAPVVGCRGYKAPQYAIVAPHSTKREPCALKREAGTAFC